MKSADNTFDKHRYCSGPDRETFGFTNLRTGASELRACSRTVGYFTPVHERGTKWGFVAQIG